jgi:hypothetical protein
MRDVKYRNSDRYEGEKTGDDWRGSAIMLGRRRGRDKEEEGEGRGGEGVGEKFTGVRHHGRHCHWQSDKQSMATQISNALDCPTPSTSLVEKGRTIEHFTTTSSTMHSARNCGAIGCISHCGSEGMWFDPHSGQSNVLWMNKVVQCSVFSAKWAIFSVP